MVVRKPEPGVFPVADHFSMRDCSLKFLFNEGSGAVVRDYSGNNRHGTIQTLGGSGGSAWVAGDHGTKLRFPNSVNGRVEVPDANAILGPAPGSFTILTRCNLSSSTANFRTACGVLNVSNTRLGLGLFVHYAVNDWRQYMTVRNADDTGAVRYFRAEGHNDLGGPSFTIAAVYNAANGISHIYRNGVKREDSAIATAGARGAMLQGGPFVVGCSYSLTSPSLALPLDGALDYLSVYQRALTAEEVLFESRYPYAAWYGMPGHRGHVVWRDPILLLPCGNHAAGVARAVAVDVSELCELECRFSGVFPPTVDNGGFALEWYAEDPTVNGVRPINDSTIAPVASTPMMRTVKLNVSGLQSLWLRVVNRSTTHSVLSVSLSAIGRLDIRRRR